MKTDRLIAVAMYLLNRDIVSTAELAKHFEVSRRTIQRDIESLNMAGIPVTSVSGQNGGYGIMKGFKIDRQIMNTGDYLNIITALRGLCSACENKKADETLEKFIPLQSARQTVYLDFGVLKENAALNESMKKIECAIKNRVLVEFEYISADGRKTKRTVQALSFVYKWYSWYLLAYCTVKCGYRLFRISRIKNINLTKTAEVIECGDIENIMKQMKSSDTRKFLNIKLSCGKDEITALLEHFPNGKAEQNGCGSFTFEFSVPENERAWFGILMSFGNRVKVIEPEELKTKLVKMAEEIIKNY